MAKKQQFPEKSRCSQFSICKADHKPMECEIQKKELIYLDSVTETVNKSHLLHRLIPTMIWRKVEQLNRTLVANQKHCASAIKKITTITLCGHCLDSELMIINQQESSWAFSGNMTYINILLIEPSNTAKMRRRKAKND